MKDAMKNELLEDDPKFETRQYSVQEKEMMLSYMKSFDAFCIGGLVFDCVLRDSVHIENKSYSDGEYLWCEQDMYHLDKYNAAVTDDFFDHVMKNSQ